MIIKYKDKVRVSTLVSGGKKLAIFLNYVISQRCVCRHLHAQITRFKMNLVFIVHLKYVHIFIIKFQYIYIDQFIINSSLILTRNIWCARPLLLSLQFALERQTHLRIEHKQHYPVTLLHCERKKRKRNVSYNAQTYIKYFLYHKL